MNDKVYTREAEVIRGTPDKPSMSGAKLTGYAVVYGAQSAAPVPIGRTYLPEVIDRGAFSASLGQNITFTFDHKDIAEYGDTASGTLRLSEDAKGIRFELDLPAYAQTLRAEIESGAIEGMSFGFIPRAMDVKDGIRHIVKADLLHISPVYSPAYAETSVSLTRTANHTAKRMKLELLEKLNKLNR